MTTFVSYAREDRDIALRLADDLRAAGIDVWIDQHNIRAGEQWDQAVERALEQSLTMLVILSPDAVQSRSVMDEVSYSLEEGKRVVPVLHRACKIPLRMRRLQYVELTSSYAEGFSRVVNALQNASATSVVTPAPTLVPTAARTPAPIARRQPVLAAAIFALCGAVCGGIVPAILGSHWIEPALTMATLGAITGAVSGGRKESVIAAVVGFFVTTSMVTRTYGFYATGFQVLVDGGGAILAASIARVVVTRRGRAVSTGPRVRLFWPVPSSLISYAARCGRRP